jgi:hypothetical protein
MGYPWSKFGYYPSKTGWILSILIGINLDKINPKMDKIHPNLAHSWWARGSP